MRIAYVIANDISTISGIVKKIESTVKYWKQNGHKVTVVSLKSNSLIPIMDNALIVSKYVKKGSFFNKFMRRLTFPKKLDAYLSEIKPDIIYTRYIVNSPDLVPIFKKHAPYIVEINSNDVEETKLGSRSRYILNLLSRNYFLNNATAFVSVSKELILANNYSKFNKKFVTIGNGYDFNSIKNIKNDFNATPRFVFIGSPNQSWHGIDKILQLANTFINYEFHIAGPTKKELKEYGIISNNVVSHGYCNSEYLENLISKCDIGIGTLALHRKKMNEASPLKSRQYLANGLPIIIGYDDTDLPKECNYTLNIGNYEKNIIDNLDKIKLFCDSINKFDKIDIRNESKKYLNLYSKEERRLNFFKLIIQESL